MESIRLDEEAVLKTVGRDERLVGASPTGSAWWNYPPTVNKGLQPSKKISDSRLKEGKYTAGRGCDRLHGCCK